MVKRRLKSLTSNFWSNPTFEACQDCSKAANSLPTTRSRLAVCSTVCAWERAKDSACSACFSMSATRASPRCKRSATSRATVSKRWFCHQTTADRPPITMIAITPNPITVREPERPLVPRVSPGFAEDAEPLEEDGELAVVDWLVVVDFGVDPAVLASSDFD